MLFKKKIIPAELVSLELRYNENRSKLVRVFVPEHKKRMPFRFRPVPS